MVRCESGSLNGSSDTSNHQNNFQSSEWRKKNELKLRKSLDADNSNGTDIGRARNVMEKCIRLEEAGIFSHENSIDQSPFLEHY